MAGELVEGARAGEEEHERFDELNRQVSRVSLDSLHLLVRGPKQVEAEDELQHKHAKSIDICVAAAS